MGGSVRPAMEHPRGRRASPTRLRHGIPGGASHRRPTLRAHGHLDPSTRAALRRRRRAVRRELARGARRGDPPLRGAGVPLGERGRRPAAAPRPRHHAGRHVRHGSGGGHRCVPRGPPSARASLFSPRAPRRGTGRELAKPLGWAGAPGRRAGRRCPAARGHRGRPRMGVRAHVRGDDDRVRPCRGAPRLDQAVAGRDRRYHRVGRMHVGGAPGPTISSAARASG